MKGMVIVVLLFVSIFQIAAEEKEKQFDLALYGFIGVNAYYDSRQNVIVRNGNIYLFPVRPDYDVNNRDINAKGLFDIDASYSRFGLRIKGPELFGANSFALLEGDFLGKSGANDLNFRLRHAYLRLNWVKSSLLVGQYWHPLFLTENFPSTVTLSCGVPFHPLNRQPMIRFGYHISKQFELIAYLMTQNDFADKGMPDGAAHALQPEMDLQVKYKNSNGIFAALTFGHKVLQPTLYEERNGEKIITNEKVKSSYVAASLRKSFDKFTIKMEGIYGGAMTNVVMLGGIAEKDNGSQLRQYTPVQTASVWTDIHTNHKKVQPGVFIGYTENLGANARAKLIVESGKTPYNLGADIGKMYTFAPRVRFLAAPKIWLGIEWMYTVAAYGSGYDDYATPINLNEVANNRITTSLRYTF